MASLGDRMAKTTRKLIVKYGMEVILTKAPPDALFESGTHRTYWMVDGLKEYIAPEGTSYAGDAIARNVKTYEALDGRIRGTDIVFEAVNIPTATTHDTIEWAGTIFNVIYIQPSVLQGVEIIQLIFARRA